MNRIVLTGILILLSGLAALAQLPTGTISGQVSGMDGICGTEHPGVMRACWSTVAGAVMIARETGTNQIRVTTTGDDGFYRFERLPNGNYEISAEKAAFNKEVQGELNLGDSGRCRSAFRSDADQWFRGYGDQDSGLMPITDSGLMAIS